MPDYERLERLGEGNFGDVWLVYDRALGVRRAVKFVRPSRIHDPTDFYREPQTLMKLRHDHIVRVEDAGKEPDGTLYIAMEYLPRGSLKDKFKGKPLPLSTACRYLCDICWGLEFAHQKGYIHRDIKPSNILIAKNGEAKLSDFGLATRIPRGRVASPYGYMTHLAPEVFREGFTTRLTDIYAIGVTAYRLFNGDSYLPTPDTEEELVDFVLNGRYPDRRRYRPCVPKPLRHILNKGMHIDPMKRYQSAASFRRALEKISLLCNWGWKPSRRSVIYRTTIGDVRVKCVVRQRPDRKFDITTTKKAGGAERRVLKDCSENLSLTEMRLSLHKILSRYVIEGR